ADVGGKLLGRSPSSRDAYGVGGSSGDFGGWSPKPGVAGSIPAGLVRAAPNGAALSVPGNLCRRRSPAPATLPVDCCGACYRSILRRFFTRSRRLRLEDFIGRPRRRWLLVRADHRAAVHLVV